ncbi:efflux RND transporter periplasmic adaptor subunit [Thiolapillus sp.]
MKATKLLFALPALLALGACNEIELGEKPVRPVQVWVASKAQIPGPLSYSGQIYARYESALAFRVDGKVISRNVELGERVEAGQVLARIDIRDLQLNIDNARAGLRAARADLAVARNERKRVRNLFEKKFASQAEMDAANNHFHTARAKVKAAEAQVEMAQNQSKYGTLKASGNGAITQIAIEAGQVVSAGQTAFRLAHEGEYEVRIRVGEQSVQMLKPNQAVRISLWADDTALLSGFVRDIAPAADQNRTWLVKISLVAPPAGLKLGMTAKVVFAPDASGGFFWLPATALFQNNEQPAVWLVDADDKVRLRNIELEQYLENGMLVSGLEEGVEVVAVGVTHLHPGQVVYPVPYTGKAHHAVSLKDQTGTGG